MRRVDVRVEGGARITTASGGKAMLFAPHVVNSGQILAPDGQVIMAAGEQIYLRTSARPELPLPTQSTFRGLDVGGVVANACGCLSMRVKRRLRSDAFSDRRKENYSSRDEAARRLPLAIACVNNGIVQADHGNITLDRPRYHAEWRVAGVDCPQQPATARSGLQGFSQGMGCQFELVLRSVRWNFVVLEDWHGDIGAGSVTAAMPDLSDTSEIELTSTGTRYRPGRVELRGNLINIEREANVIVPAGTISVVASTDGWATDDPATGERKRDGSRIYIGEDAYLSVAGLQDILIAMERNVVRGRVAHQRAARFTALQRFLAARTNGLC